MNGLPCGIKMWAQVSFVLPQSMHLTDEQTNGQEDLRYTVCRITYSVAW